MTEPALTEAILFNAAGIGYAHIRTREDLIPISLMAGDIGWMVAPDDCTGPHNAPDLADLGAYTVDPETKRLTFGV